jgi:hypothetical protein
MYVRPRKRQGYHRRCLNAENRRRYAMRKVA